ncbi:hypothetical protein AWH04_03515 [Rhodococcus erythropolis]|uniref:TerD family protein n=1 Tax=Rhodococcus sp. WY5 TaxID=2708349 RepID=UPI000ED08587|nr:TerD family protein [Rhodococcus sp. WY5]RGP45293.1 hypothetical protein AWH04_03515 [Rhodococcus erythropolis]
MPIWLFFNNPTTPEGAVTLAGGQVTLNLGTVPAAIDTLAVAVALDENVPGSLAQVPGLAVRVTQVGGVSFVIPAEGLTTERSAVLLEVYRRNGTWKVRNRSAGWSGGLGVLVTEHGVSVDETSEEPRLSARRRVPAGLPSAIQRHSTWRRQMRGGRPRAGKPGGAQHQRGRAAPPGPGSHLVAGAGGAAGGEMGWFTGPPASSEGRTLSRQPARPSTGSDQCSTMATGLGDSR